MLKIAKHKIYSQETYFHLKILLVFFVFLISSNIVKSQTDEVFQNETETYRAENKQDNSWLYWEVSGGEILSENPSQTDSIVVKWTVTGIGMLSVYEKTELNCNGQTTSIELNIKESDANIELDIPNIFTPNEDGLNDYFTIGYNFPPDNYKITIFNRWGNSVFETHDILYSWDGRIAGEYCKSGVYYYVIQYLDNNKMKIIKGTVHVFPDK